MGSTSDEPHAKKITEKLDDYGVSWEQHAASAHKQPLNVLELLDDNKDKENIIFLENNNLDLWVNKIKEIYDDTDLLSTISVNSKKLVVQEYALEIFDKELEKCLILK